jgi:hypothetical protein
MREAFHPHFRKAQKQEAHSAFLYAASGGNGAERGTYFVRPFQAPSTGCRKEDCGCLNSLILQNFE